MEQQQREADKVVPKDHEHNEEQAQETTTAANKARSGSNSSSGSRDSNIPEDARGMEEKGHIPVDVLATDPKDIIDAGPGLSAGQQHELERALKASLSSSGSN